MWYRDFRFKQDPYSIRDPQVIPLSLIEWNRDDLGDANDFKQFLQSVLNTDRVGLKAYGQDGCGKTWLARVIEKNLVQAKGKSLVIYTKIQRLQPEFSPFYELFLSGIRPHLDKILAALAKEAGPTPDRWVQVTGDQDLGQCLWHLYHMSNREDITRTCNDWLDGLRLGRPELTRVSMSWPLDKDYRKFEVMRSLIGVSLYAFSTCTLIVDELENAPVQFARRLGDSLRDMIDSFYDRFSLVCMYTAEIADEMLDRGYGEFLYGRLEWAVKLDAVQLEYAPVLLRQHHSIYRSKTAKAEIKDQLWPFSEGGIKRLIQLMDRRKWYPRFIFINCGRLAREAAQAKEEINEDFVNAHKNRLQDLAPA